MRYVTVVLVVLFVACVVPVAADVFGLAPTLGGDTPLVAEQRGASGPLPSTIIGLESYSLFGRNAGAAGAVTFKRRFGSTPIGDRTLRWRYGAIAGLAVADETTNPLIGGFVECELEGLVGLVLVVRADDGVYANYGFKLNLLSVSF